MSSTEIIFEVREDEVEHVTYTKLRGNGNDNGNPESTY